MSTTAGRIGQIQLVAIPVSDQERSLGFYEGLGFERRNDIPWGDGYRWVEVYPPNWGDHRGQAAKVKGGYSSRMSSRYASTRRSQRRTPTAKS